jgi:hypothetical protein
MTKIRRTAKRALAIVDAKYISNQLARVECENKKLRIKARFELI